MHLHWFSSILIVTANGSILHGHNQKDMNMRANADLKMEVFNTLTDAQIPVHPIKYKSKSPMFGGWTQESTRYKVDKIDNKYIITQKGNIESNIVSDFNVGIKAGASIGIAHDNYLCYLDIDFPDNIDRDKSGKVNNSDTAEVMKKELERALHDFCRISKIPRSKIIMERSGGKHRGFHIPFVSPLPLLSQNNCVIYSDHKYLTSFDIYAYNKDFGVKNIVVAPSFDKYDYAVYVGGKRAQTKEDYLEAYKSIPKMNFSGWLGLTNLYKEDCISVNRFALINRAVLPSTNINYELFGGIYSGMAAKSGVDKELYKKMVNTTLSQIPSPKTDTVENIDTYIDATYEKFEKNKLNPRGIPALLEHISAVWKANRAINDDKVLKEELKIFGNIVSDTLEYHKASKKQRKFDELKGQGYVSRTDALYDRYTREPNIDSMDENKINIVIDSLYNPSSILKKNRSIIERFASSGNIIIYGATPGTGKSVSLIDGLYSASIGELVWGTYVVNRPRKVLYLYADKDSSDFEDKYLKNYMHDVTDNDNFKTLYADSFRNSGYKPDLADPVSRLVLKNVCKKFKPDILVFDTFKTWFPTFNENDSVESNTIYEVFLSLTREYDCCAFLVTHTPKSKADNYSNAMYHAAKGAGALVDRATTVAYITSQHDERDKPIKNKNYLSFPKTGVNTLPPIKFEIKNREEYDIVNNITKKEWYIEYEESTDDEFNLDNTMEKDKQRENRIMRGLLDGPLPLSSLYTILNVPSEMKNRNAIYVINDALKKGFIEKVGRRRAAKYYITESGKQMINGNIKDALKIQEEEKKRYISEYADDPIVEQKDGYVELYLPESYKELKDIVDERRQPDEV